MHCTVQVLYSSLDYPAVSLGSSRVAAILQICWQLHNCMLLLLLPVRMHMHCPCGHTQCAFLEYSLILRITLPCNQSDSVMLLQQQILCMLCKCFAIALLLMKLLLSWPSNPAACVQPLVLLLQRQA